MRYVYGARLVSLGFDAEYSPKMELKMMVQLPQLSAA